MDIAAGLHPLGQTELRQIVELRLVKAPQRLQNGLANAILWGAAAGGEHDPGGSSGRGFSVLGGVKGSGPAFFRAPVPAALGEPPDRLRLRSFRLRPLQSGVAEPGLQRVADTDGKPDDSPHKQRYAGCVPVPGCQKSHDRNRRKQHGPKNRAQHRMEQERDSEGQNVDQQA